MNSDSSPGLSRPSPSGDDCTRRSTDSESKECYFVDGRDRDQLFTAFVSWASGYDSASFEKFAHQQIGRIPSVGFSEGLDSFSVEMLPFEPDPFPSELPLDITLKDKFQYWRGG
jgi:hypothetical protein